MILIETAHFKKNRKRLKNEQEKIALKEAVLHIQKDPFSGKKLKSDFKDLQANKYTVKGQSKRLIYKIEKDTLVLFSFGPRGNIYR